MPRALLSVLAAFALALAAAAPAAAQDGPLPALYDVRGVAPDDVLNVRAAPSADAARIGALAPGARGVEVTAIDSAAGWGRVNAGEQAGWVSMRFLARQPRQGGNALPVPMRCFGTEPFWSLSVAEDGLRLEGPGVPRAVTASLSERTRAAGRPDAYGFVGWGAGGGQAIHGTVRRARCSDGMSDRLFGLSADLLVQDGGALRQYAGCCTLAR
ncbi:COG3650 family protein [Rhodosalinus sp. 5P4]|uniref:COG3650 family protein n=1 Tax=Rhodosalinus sp. 5P4 TaxID=3239196 RepID=UPI00352524B1